MLAVMAGENTLFFCLVPLVLQGRKTDLSKAQLKRLLSRLRQDNCATRPQTAGLRISCQENRLYCQISLFWQRSVLFFQPRGRAAQMRSQRRKQRKRKDGAVQWSCELIKGLRWEAKSERKMCKMDEEEETAWFVKEKWGINIRWEVSLLGRSKGFPSSHNLMQADPWHTHTLTHTLNREQNVKQYPRLTLKGTWKRDST